MNSVAKISWVIRRIQVNNQDVIALRKARIVRVLNRQFYSVDSATENARYVGSFARGTAIRSVSDIDLLFELPPSVYNRYNSYSFNGQSALLQNIKNYLIKIYPTTDISGDGQVVVIYFKDLHFDILPAFKTTDRKYVYPDTHDNGSWRPCDPMAEISLCKIANLNFFGKFTRLAQLTRAWREANNVQISGFLIDTLVFQFLNQWEDSNSKGIEKYPHMLIEFLYFLSRQNRDQDFWLAPGSGQRVYRDGLFEAKADKGYNDAVFAIDNDKYGFTTTSKPYWKSLFGKYFEGTL